LPTTAHYRRKAWIRSRPRRRRRCAGVECRQRKELDCPAIILFRNSDVKYQNSRGRVPVSEFSPPATPATEAKAGAFAYQGTPSRGKGWSFRLPGHAIKRQRLEPSLTRARHEEAKAGAFAYQGTPQRGKGWSLRLPGTPSRGKGWSFRLPGTPSRAKGWSLRLPGHAIKRQKAGAFAYQRTPSRGKGWSLRLPGTPSRGKGWSLRLPGTPSRGKGWSLRLLGHATRGKGWSLRLQASNQIEGPVFAVDGMHEHSRRNT